MAFVVPALVVLAAVTFYPLVVSAIMSVSDVTIATINKPAWDLVGLRNYMAVVESPIFIPVVGQTILYVVLVVTIGLVGGLIVATILKRGTRIAYGVGALMLFVWSLPPVVGGSLWKFSYSQDGPINAVLQLFGLSEVPWLVDPRLALFSVAMVNAWVAVPFTSAVLRAALLDIPPELLEASEIDGAGRWRQFRYVVLPLLVPTMSVLGVLMILSAFRSFDYIYVMTAGGPGVATSTLPYLSYTESFVLFRFDQGAALAVIAIIIVLPVVWFYIRLRRKEVSA